MDDIPKNTLFTGHIFLFHAFDVGDDIDLEKIEQNGEVNIIHTKLPRYFKNYHTPLSVELPHPHAHSHTVSCNIHTFGAISLIYKIPVKDTFNTIREKFSTLCDNFHEQSVVDVKSIFSKIKPQISKPHFFETHSSYAMVQIDQQKDQYTIKEFQEKYNDIIASMMRFEVQALAEDQKNEILESSLGYFRGDYIVIDTDVAFVYDDAYQELLYLFEFANIQQLELRYFDRILDTQLKQIYEEGGRKLPLLAHFPLIGTFVHTPVDQLNKLRVDISVITERLESSIKLSGEPYFADLYNLLNDKLDLKNWQNGIDRKLGIIRDVQEMLQHKTEINREDILSILIVILIFIELMIGLLDYLK